MITFEQPIRYHRDWTRHANMVTHITLGFCDILTPSQYKGFFFFFNSCGFDFILVFALFSSKNIVPGPSNKLTESITPDFLFSKNVFMLCFIVISPVKKIWKLPNKTIQSIIQIQNIQPWFFTFKCQLKAIELQRKG